eukprot:jgi/Hompol1/2236/HPOL_002158-RA
MAAAAAAAAAVASSASSSSTPDSPRAASPTGSPTFSFGLPPGSMAATGGQSTGASPTSSPPSTPSSQPRRISSPTPPLGNLATLGTPNLTPSIVSASRTQGLQRFASVVRVLPRPKTSLVRTGELHFEPQLKVTGDATPTELVQTLGVNKEDIPKMMHTFVTIPLSDLVQHVAKGYRAFVIVAHEDGFMSTAESLHSETLSSFEDDS